MALVKSGVHNRNVTLCSSGILGCIDLERAMIDDLRRTDFGLRKNRTTEVLATWKWFSLGMARRHQHLLLRTVGTTSTSTSTSTPIEGVTSPQPSSPHSFGLPAWLDGSSCRARPGRDGSGTAKAGDQHLQRCGRCLSECQWDSDRELMVTQTTRAPGDGQTLPSRL
jgi:hypothetical protein